jgi:hypothetical protein
MVELAVLATSVQESNDKVQLHRIVAAPFRRFTKSQHAARPPSERKIAAVTVNHNTSRYMERAFGNC